MQVTWRSVNYKNISITLFTIGMSWLNIMWSSARWHDAAWRLCLFLIVGSFWLSVDCVHSVWIFMTEEQSIEDKRKSCDVQTDPVPSVQQEEVGETTLGWETWNLNLKVRNGSLLKWLELKWDQCYCVIPFQNVFTGTPFFRICCMNTRLWMSWLTHPTEQVGTRGAVLVLLPDIGYRILARFFRGMLSCHLFKSYNVGG